MPQIGVLAAASDELDRVSIDIRPDRDREHRREHTLMDATGASSGRISAVAPIADGREQPRHERDIPAPPGSIWPVWSRVPAERTGRRRRDDMRLVRVR
jgi:hypothetical protein